jgi:hypothetical protein
VVAQASSRTFVCVNMHTQIHVHVPGREDVAVVGACLTRTVAVLSAGLLHACPQTPLLVACWPVGEAREGRRFKGAAERVGLPSSILQVGEGPKSP